MASVTVTLPTTTSWKTTLSGALMSVAIYLSSLDGYYAIVGKALVVIIPIVWGLVQKDSDVTGGTVVQPSSVEAKAAVTTTPTATATTPAV